jgi:hypothetical protein
MRVWWLEPLYSSRAMHARVVSCWPFLASLVEGAFAMQAFVAKIAGFSN